MENYENKDLNIVDDSSPEVQSDAPAEPVQETIHYQEASPQPDMPAEKSRIPAYGMSIASLVLALASFLPFLCCFQPILAVVAIILGAVARSKGNRSGMSLAGIILGGIALALFVVQSYLVIDILETVPFNFDDFDNFHAYYDF